MSGPTSAAAAPRRDALAWLAAAACVAAWTLLRPAYIPADLGPPVLGLARTTWTGGGLLAAGVALATLLGWRRGRPWLGLGLGLSMAAVTGAGDALLSWWEAARQPEMPAFSAAAWALAKLAGEPVAWRGGRLLYDEAQGALEFAPTWGLTAMRPLLQFWLAGGLILCLRERKPRNDATPALLSDGLRLLLLPLLFFGLRYGYLVLRYSSVDEVLAQTAPPALVLFWSPAGMAAALLLSAAAMAWTEGPVGWRPPAPARAWLWAASCAGVAGLCFGSAFAWEDPGRPKSGRVLVDDRLTGAWEPAGRLLDTQRYGDFSAYSFSAMVEQLSHRYAVAVNAERAYTRDYLDQFDVLMLKTPEQPLAEPEIAAIHGWVADGGGLFLISDHTDLMGMSTYLRPLGGPYGLDFRFDATNDAVTGGFDYWRPGLVPEHPVSAGLEVFECMTPCSIRLSGPARPVLTLRRSASTAGDYAHGSNFGTRAPNPADAHGLLVIAAAARAGRGRVLAFSDSTVLSSFAYYTWSHSDFIQRGVTWLNRRNSAAAWLGLAFAVLGSAALLLALRGRAGAEGWIAAAAAVALGGLAGALAAAHVSAAAVAVPEPVDGTVRVGFVREGGHAWLPAVLGSQPEDMPPHGNLMTFIQTPQRLGMETRVVRRDPAVLSELDVLVIMNPDVELGQPEAPAGWIEAVRSWVSAGGRLVVTARREHLGHPHDRYPLYVDGLEFEEAASPEPELRLGVAALGQGRVVAVEGSEVLDVEHMGHCMQYPGRDELRRYAAAFEVFGHLCGLSLPERRGYRPR
ncbi:MAG: hypothetical protein EYC70_17210 [Planctomycetota bacterium]|nr:MAG: hypothetical protein EYC70_17210 [Planctomycetota bacterium]